MKARRVFLPFLFIILCVVSIYGCTKSTVFPQDWLNQLPDEIMAGHCINDNVQIPPEQTSDIVAALKEVKIIGEDDRDALSPPGSCKNLTLVYADRTVTYTFAPFYHNDRGKAKYRMTCEGDNMEPQEWEISKESYTDIMRLIEGD